MIAFDVSLQPQQPITELPVDARHLPFLTEWAWTGHNWVGALHWGQQSQMEGRQEGEFFSKEGICVKKRRSGGKVFISLQWSLYEWLFHAQFCLFNDVIASYNRVFKCLKDSDAYKARDLYIIHPRICKETASDVTEPLMLLFNKSFKEGNVPNDWTTTTIRLIHQKDKN